MLFMEEMLILIDLKLKLLMFMMKIMLLKTKKRDATAHLLKLKEENRAHSAKLDELNGDAGDLVEKKNKLEK